MEINWIICIYQTIHVFIRSLSQSIHPPSFHPFIIQPPLSLPSAPSLPSIHPSSIHPSFLFPTWIIYVTPSRLLGLYTKIIFSESPLLGPLYRMFSSPGPQISCVPPQLSFSSFFQESWSIIWLNIHFSFMYAVVCFCTLYTIKCYYYSMIDYISPVMHSIPVTSFCFITGSLYLLTPFTYFAHPRLPPVCQPVVSSLYLWVCFYF